MAKGTGSALRLEAFLSHRYKSPDVNLFFFRLLVEHANVQFGVDRGTFATNVGRLERLIRNAHAFIGIYPFPGDPRQRPSHDELLSASRYFRLELDIAARARKPTLMFFDQRYGDVLIVPESVCAIPFDPQEICLEGGAPREPLFRRRISDFWRLVRAEIDVSAQRTAAPHAGRVGLIVPGADGRSNGYDDREIDSIRCVARETGIHQLASPPGPLVLEGGMYRWLESLDWAIVDVGERMMRTGMVGHLHGRGLPMVRLYKGARSAKEVDQEPGFRCLFGGVEVGYPKDTVFWTPETGLEAELKSRLEGIRREPERLRTISAAEEYFRSASLRNESVFLSYSGRDQEVASQISRALKARFQTVFDYRDGESLTPGQPWLEGIFDQLARAALGVVLISAEYLASGNCTHEARQIVAQQDSGKMVVIPIKLKRDPLDPPTWMTSTQWLRLWEYPDVETAVSKVVESFDKGLKRAGS